MKADYEQIDQLVTREQILAAKERELDILVLKHIYKRETMWLTDDMFGRCLYAVDNNAIRDGHSTTTNLAGGRWQDYGENDNGEKVTVYCRPAPRYSEEITDTWKIVEKINQMPWRMQRSYKDLWQVGRLGYCVAWCEENSCNDKDKVCSWCECGKVVWAETAQEAICKAALLAVLEADDSAR